MLRSSQSRHNISNRYSVIYISVIDVCVNCIILLYYFKIVFYIDINDAVYGFFNKWGVQQINFFLVCTDAQTQTLDFVPFWCSRQSSNLIVDYDVFTYTNGWYTNIIYNIVNFIIYKYYYSYIVRY